MNYKKYTKEELTNFEKIDFSTIDYDSIEEMDFFKNKVSDFFKTIYMGLDASDLEVKQLEEKVRAQLQQLDQKAIERKRTILSNIIFFITSVISVELTPSSLYGKQKLSGKQLEELEKMKSEGMQLLDNFKTFKDFIEKSREEFKMVEQDLLSDDKKMIDFLRSLMNRVNDYVNDESKFVAYKFINSIILVGTLIDCNYIDVNQYGTEKDCVKKFVNNGVALKNTYLPEKIIEMNSEYIEKYSKGKQSTK